MRHSGAIKTTTSALVLLAISTINTAHADNIANFLEAIGDGSVLVDPDEGVTAPGITIITGNSGNDAAFPGYDGTDFVGNGFSQRDNENCIRASGVGVACDDPQKSGKRDKLLLTGPGPLDLVFDSTDTNDGTTDYLAISKVTNTTGARMIGYQVQIGYGTGNDFQLVSVAGNTAVQFDNLLDKTLATNPSTTTWAGSNTALAQSPLQRTFYAAGLFGLESQDTDGDGNPDAATVGFFTPDQRVALNFDPANATAVGVQEVLVAGGSVQFDPGTGAVTGTTFTDLFGANTALIPFAFSPQGILWDNDGDPSTDGILMAAYLNGQWVTYRTRNLDGTFAVVDPNTIDGAIPAGGVMVPDPTGAGTADVLTDAEVAALLADPAYSQDVIEDLAKVNLNFGIDIADLDGFNNGQFTVRFVPVFAPVVAAAQNSYQFDLAANLDAGRIPALALDAALASTAAAIEALPAAQRAAAIEQTGFGFLSAFDVLTNSAGRAQLNNAFFRIDGTRSGSGSVAHEGAVATSGPNVHAYSDTFSMFISGGALFGNVDRQGSSRGFDYDTYAGSLGGDFKVGESTIIGASVGYSFGEADIDNNIGTLEAGSFSVLGYVSTNWASGLYVDGALGYGYSDYDSTRRLSIGGITNTFLGSTEGHSVLGRIQGGFDFAASGWRYGPVGDLTIIHSNIGGFTESGGGIALNVASQDISSIQGAIGARAVYDIQQDWGAIVMHGKAMLAQEFGDTDRNVNTSFVGGVAAGFDTPVTNGPETFALLNTGVSAVISDNGATTTAFGLDYNGRFGSDAIEHRGTASIKVRW